MASKTATRIRKEGMPRTRQLELLAEVIRLHHETDSPNAQEITFMVEGHEIRIKHLGGN